MQETIRQQKNYEAHVEFYTQELVDMLENTKGRLFIGITGGPASGKSTFATDLVTGVNVSRGEEVAIVAPLDGYHLPNSVLQELGMWELKGIPDTFDTQGFIDFLIRLRDYPDEVSLGPIFDRVTDEPIQEVLIIKPNHRLIVVEGNYLLYDRPPWDQAREIFAEVWYLEVLREAVVERLQVRHAKRGLQGEEIDVKINSTDMPNARLIAQTRSRADKLLHLPQNKRIS